MFNALKYTQELEKAGFSREQAEVSVRLLIDVMNENLATKSDLNEATLRLEYSIRELEYKMTVKLGSMIALAIGVTATLVKLI